MQETKPSKIPTLITMVREIYSSYLATSLSPVPSPARGRGEKSNRANLRTNLSLYWRERVLNSQQQD